MEHAIADITMIMLVLAVYRACYYYIHASWTSQKEIMPLVRRSSGARATQEIHAPPSLLRFRQETMDWMGIGLHHEIAIINDSNRIIYVTIEAPRFLFALDPGHLTVYQITSDTTRVTISYYGEDHETKNLCTSRQLGKNRLLRVYRRRGYLP